MHAPACSRAFDVGKGNAAAFKFGLYACAVMIDEEVRR